MDGDPMETTPVHLRPLGVGEVLDVALKLVWQNAGTFVRIVLVVVVPLQIVISLLFASGTSEIHTTRFTLAGQTFSETRVDNSGALIAAFAIAGVLTVLMLPLASGACYRAVAAAYLGEPVSWRASLGYCFRRLHSVLWLLFLNALVVLIGSLFCVIPGIYLAVAFAVALPVLLDEGTKGRRALGRSRQLVRGYWWRTIGVIVLGYLLTSILTWGLGIGLQAAVHEPLDSTGGVIVNVVVSAVSRVITTPFAAAFVTVLYFDLRVRKEAFDLQLLAGRVGVEPPPGALAAPAGPPLARPPSSEPPFWPPPPGWKPGGDGS